MLYAGSEFTPCYSDESNKVNTCAASSDNSDMKFYFYATSTPSVSVSLFNTLSAPYALSLSKYRVHQCSLLVIFLAISGDDATNESTGESTGDVYLYCLDVTDSNNILGANSTSSLSLL